MTEFLWATTRPRVPKRDGRTGPAGKVLNLAGATIPEQHLETLKLGPKFCVEPRLSTVEKVALARTISKHVNDDERSRCVSECADVMRSLKETDERSIGLPPLADSLREKKLKLMTADKEGFFVLLTEGQFSEKASAALTKNFRLTTGETKKVKERAKDFLQELNLERLSRSVAKAQGLCLEPFFSIKTHKPEQPFRTIVSENGSFINLSAEATRKISSARSLHNKELGGNC